MEERERRMAHVREILERAGFLVTDAHGIRPTSFDLLARRDSQLIILKVLKNIDALSPQDADRLRELSALFHARPLIVGETSGASDLEDGVVYTRYGIGILTGPSLEEYLLRGVPPFLVSSPGGIFARIDGARLRELREDRGISLGALASVAGVTRRTIQLYEEGGGAEISVVERIEGFLHETVALPIDLFAARAPLGRPEAPAPPAPGPEGKSEPAERSPPPRTGDALRDDVFRRLDTMGWKVVLTVRCPFDAFTHANARGEEEVLLTSVGSMRTALHRAEVLQGLARVIEGHSMFVTNGETNRSSIDGLPIVTVVELLRHRDRAELMDLLTEREGS
jgi:putative transcriptional regulator